MHFEQRAESLSPSEVAALLASYRFLEENNETLQAQVAQLKHQLDWFKKQLFRPSRSNRSRPTRADGMRRRPMTTLPAGSSSMTACRSR
jgi:hypothetical protein